MTFTAQTSDLSKVGELIGHPALSGTASARGTLTGNGTELRAEGSLEGSGVAYSTFRAADLDATFTAAIPQLNFSRATGSTNARATMIEAGALDITGATLKASYDGKDVTSSQRARSGRELATPARDPACGAQEVHLSALTIASGNSADARRWRCRHPLRPAI